MLDSLLRRLEGKRQTVIELQRRLVAVPALGPDNEGQGEWAKAQLTKAMLTEMSLGVDKDMHAPDSRVPDGLRPNFTCVIPGMDRSKTLWVISHLDIVPPGDLSLWEGDPYLLRVEGDQLYGRGTEDNNQAAVSSLILAQSILEEGLTPPINLGMLFVADEETASKFGLEYVIKHHADYFRPGDLFLVPDFGGPDSSMMEVAEKSIFWLKITVFGKQCHASTPEQGNNTLVAASDLVLRIRELYNIFDARDEMFNPPFSTFEPTKKEANVENVNTVPGKDVFYVDCRVLPCYPLAQVMDKIRELGRQVEAKYGVRVEYQDVQREDAAPPTSPESEVVTRLAAAIRRIYDVEPKPTGIGGGTVAAVLRRAGHPAVVWSTLNHNAHQPNEHSSITFTIGDAKVMAAMLWPEG
ncbi:MAG: M20 family metallo-hydrolase [Desulfocurvibacter africanus]